MLPGQSTEQVVFASVGDFYHGEQNVSINRLVGHDADIDTEIIYNRFLFNDLSNSTKFLRHRVYRARRASCSVDTYFGITHCRRSTDPDRGAVAVPGVRRVGEYLWVYAFHIIGHRQ